MFGSTKHCFWPASRRWSSSLQKWYLSSPARNQRIKQGSIILLYILYIQKKNDIYNSVISCASQVLETGLNGRLDQDGASWFRFLYLRFIKLIAASSAMTSSRQVLFSGSLREKLGKRTPFAHLHKISSKIDRSAFLNPFWNFKIGTRILES